jgi:hypothetical protein
VDDEFDELLRNDAKQEGTATEDVDTIVADAPHSAWTRTTHRSSAWPMSAEREVSPYHEFLSIRRICGQRTCFFPPTLSTRDAGLGYNNNVLQSPAESTRRKFGRTESLPWLSRMFALAHAPGAAAVRSARVFREPACLCVRCL